jgi:pyridoxamine 5'-phosphate oxidase
MYPSAKNNLNNVKIETPINPMELVRAWIDDATKNNVHQPGTMALATADREGKASNRIVHMLEARDEGIVFATHSGSLKGIQLTQTGWSSAVHYWQEIGRQIISTGPTQAVSSDESDALWSARPIAMLPMSVVSKQSQTLYCENELRKKANRLKKKKTNLQRPATWLGYLLEPQMIEFWQADDELLHYRLRYDRAEQGWNSCRLQP